jgi:hypothetical protein
MTDIQHREKRNAREKRERAAEMLARVGIPDAGSEARQPTRTSSRAACASASPSPWR